MELPEGEGQLLLGQDLDEPHLLVFVAQQLQRAEEDRIVEQENAETSVHNIVSEAPTAWFKTQLQPPRIAIYAHGGLNNEEGSIQRIRTLAPYFAANGIYPLFVTWKTGAIETLSDIIQDQLQRLPRPEGGIEDTLDRVKDAAIEAFDRTIEVIVRPAVKPIWSQMKQNAAASSEQGHGGALIAAALLELKKRVPNLEVHLIGHSTDRSCSGTCSTCSIRRS